jgi:transcriptional antiterminator
VAEKEAKRSTKHLRSPANDSFIPGDPNALKLANDTREAKQQARREQLMMLHRATAMTRAQLAETLGVSESTIKRDIKALNLNGRH